MSMVSYNQVEFGKRLKELRKQNKMTQEVLAEKLMVSVDSISKYENGKIALGHEYLTTICQLFNVSADYFYFGIEKSLIREEDTYMNKVLNMISTKSNFDQKRVYEMMQILFQVQEA